MIMCVAWLTLHLFSPPHSVAPVTNVSYIAMSFFLPISSTLAKPDWTGGHRDPSAGKLVFLVWLLSKTRTALEQSETLSRVALDIYRLFAEGTENTFY